MKILNLLESICSLNCVKVISMLYSSEIQEGHVRKSNHAIMFI